MPGPIGEILSVGQNGRIIDSTKDSRINARLFAGVRCQVLAICKGWCAVTIDQQIRKARELLAPPLHARAECQCDISRALDSVEIGAAVARSFRVAGSKKGVMRYCAALRRLRDTYNSLDPAIRRWFSLAERAYVAGNATVFDREIARIEFVSQPAVTAAAARCQPAQNRSGGGAQPAPEVGPQGRRHARREVGAVSYNPGWRPD